jgi:8-oxo-dGTP pyrophosphatase MutT (NUDIX family)
MPNPPGGGLEDGETIEEAAAREALEGLGKPGQDVLVRFTTEPNIEMYELVRDYMDFRIERLKKQMKPNPE